MTIKNARILWIVAIVMMGFTTAMNLFGGTGTVCAAFLTKSFPTLWQDLEYYRWLYQRLMITTIIIGLTQIWGTYALFRCRQNAYRNAVALLVIGTLVADLQVRASLDLRHGEIAPANVKFYFNLFTLIYFLMMGLPTFRRWIDFTQPGGKTEMAAAGGITSLAVGISMLTINLWVGPSHTVEGTNWVDALQPHLTIGGIIMTGIGLVILVKALPKLARRPATGPLLAAGEVSS